MNGDLTFQYYFTVFIDLIGQRETLKKFNDIPTNETEKEQFIELIRNSVGNVIHFRESFNDFFESAASYIPDANLVKPELREEYFALQKSEIIMNSFSDSIIIAVPLMNNDEFCRAMNGVFNSITAICGVGILYLSAGVPFRAGLDVGIGTNISDKEVYGAALERAYYLDSCLADPRYLVGTELVSYLSAVESQEPTTRFGLVAKSLAGRCKHIFCIDSDGRLMLDFLGNNIHEILKDSVDKDVIIKTGEFY